MKILKVTMILTLFLFAGEIYASDSGVSPNVISLPKGPGSIEGLGEEFGPVGNSGTANYNVSIEVPQGSNGFVPSIKIFYDGGKGNSPLGFGWTLPLPRIQRQTDKGLPRYGEADTFIYQDGLSGEEIVPLKDGSYRFKNEGMFTRITRTDIGWEAKTKSGVTYRFGLKASARIKDLSGSKVFAWNISEMVDTNGNKIAFDWTIDKNQGYISSIRYNDYGSDVLCEVIFKYSTRPDVLSDYRSTFQIATAFRLSQIDVQRGKGVIRSYRFEYDVDSTLSRLMKVVLIGRDGKTQLPPVSFQYYKFQPLVQSVVEMQNPPGIGLADPDNSLVDLNGDGLPDLLSTTSGSYTYYTNEDGISWDDSKKMNLSPSYELGQENVKLADFNGDGLSDLVVARGTEKNAYFSGTTTAEFSASVELDQNPVGFVLSNPNTRFVDLNGDRLIDVFMTKSTGAGAWIHKGAGAFERLNSIPKIDLNEQIMFSDSQIRLADMNGDGLLDILRIRSGSLVYWPSMGYGIFDVPVIMSGIPTVKDESRLNVVDINGDGLSDIVYLGIDSINYWLSKGNNSFDVGNSITGTPSANPVTTSVQFADMNGNGTVDIVWVDVSGKEDTAWRYLDPIGTRFTGLLLSIDNGLGKKIGIEYASSTSEMIKAAEDGMPWQERLPFPLPVVKRVVTDDGLGTKSVMEYTYRDGYYDGNEREFRGFAGVMKKDFGDEFTASLISREIYDVGKVTEALKGKMLEESLENDEGLVYKRSKNVWDPKKIAIGTDLREIVFSALANVITTIKEAGASAKYARQDFYYDGYGNVVDSLDHGEVTSSSDDGSKPYGDDEVFVHNAYALNESAWIIDKVSRVRVTDAKGTKHSDIVYYYDGAIFEGLPEGKVERGNLMREERWLNTEDRFISTAKYRHDEWGNVTAMLDAKGGRREVFFDNASHTYPVRELIFTGSSGLDYVAEYDDWFGKIKTLIDPNNVPTFFDYDVFGRLKSVVKSGDTAQLPTMEYVYNLSSPISTITTRTREMSGEQGTLEAYSLIDGLGRVRGEIIEDDGGYIVSKATIFGARGKGHFIADPFKCSDLSGDCAPNINAIASKSGIGYQFDSLGRVVKTKNPDGTFATVEYRPLEERIFDESDNDQKSSHFNTPTNKRFDGQGRLTQISYRNASTDVTTGFSYDISGNLVSVRDTAGSVRRQTYDSLGRMLSIEDPNAGKRKYIYDDVGNLIEKQKPTGEKIKYKYELTTHRLLAKNLSTVGADDSWEVIYHYDDPSSWDRHGSYTKGRLTWVEDEAGKEYYGYDARGRNSNKRREINSIAYDFSFSYDAMDRELGVTYPDRTTASSSYNSRGLLKGVESYLIDRTYNPAGMVETETLGDGIKRSYAYDLRHRVSGISVNDFAGKAIQQFNYDFDPSGNILSVADKRDVASERNQSQTFVYDDIYRLAKVDYSNGNITWGYSDSGNIIARNSTFGDVRLNSGAMGYGERGAGPYAMTSIGDKTYDYDANGNLSHMPGQSLTFDAEDRLINVAKDDGSYTQMIYDFQGDRKIKKEVSLNGAIEETIYVDKYYEVRGTKHYKYIWAGTKRIARVETSPVVASLTPMSLGAIDTSAGVISPLSLQILDSEWLSLLGSERAIQTSPEIDLMLSLLFVILVLLALCHCEPVGRGNPVPSVIAPVRLWRKEPLADAAIYSLNFRTLSATMALLLMISTIGPTITGCGGVSSDDVLVENIQIQEEEKPSETVPEKLSIQPGVVYYIGDHLDSAHMMVDSRGNVLREESRYPYGLDKRIDSESEVAADYVYTGKEYDDSTGLMYFGKRYYSPEMARWISPDPLFLERPKEIVGRSLENNLYSYVANNPVNYFDLQGFRRVTVTVERVEETFKSTISNLYLDGKQSGNTLELPWVDNKNNVSRIPEGKRLLTFENSPKFGVDTLTVNDVLGRKVIRMHAGNSSEDTEGCILLGIFQTENKIEKSRETLNQMKDYLKNVYLEDMLSQEPTEMVIDIKDKIIHVSE